MYTIYKYITLTPFVILLCASVFEEEEEEKYIYGIYTHKNKHYKKKKRRKRKSFISCFVYLLTF